MPLFDVHLIKGTSERRFAVVAADKDAAILKIKKDELFDAKSGHTISANEVPSGVLRYFENLKQS